MQIKVDTKEALRLQRFLVTKLLVVNTGLSSLVTNFMTDAADTMERDEEDIYTAFITDHKTAASRGTAFLQMRRAEYRYLKGFQYGVR